MCIRDRRQVGAGVDARARARARFGRARRRRSTVFGTHARGRRSSARGDFTGGFAQRRRRVRRERGERVRGIQSAVDAGPVPNQRGHDRSVAVNGFIVRESLALVT